MECLSQIWIIVPCLWDCSSKHAAYIRHLEDNLSSLRNAIENLNSLSQDVRNNVHDAQQQHRRLKNQVTGWLRRVEVLEQRVNLVLIKGTQEVENKCVWSCCPQNCWSSYRLGKKVMKMIPEVRGLTDEGRFEGIADDNFVAAPVDELPVEGPVVGFESKFEEVWQSIQDKNSSIVGLVGIGGVGKTTLLKQLNNEFLKISHKFDLVIWIVVSKPADLGRIQNTIRTKINIPNYLWENKSYDEREIMIFNKIKEKKFVVLLDDLWEKLELSTIGIPTPQRGMNNISRVVFTTRSEEVCGFLDAHKIIRVGCLPPDQALDLFRSKVGEDVLKFHEETQQLVRDVANECGGLPLALITIGRAMRGKTYAQQWKDAKRTLMMYPSTFPGVKGEIFSKLLFSYDSLPTPTLQKCFEYCSIFPEDHESPKEELIRLWIAEGIIDEYVNIYDALMQGRQIIESLMQACLLEVGEKEEDRVKMHDVIRDMALWLACERGEKKNKCLVVDTVTGSDRGMPAMTQWRNVERVSLWGSGCTVKSLAGLSFCSNLITLIIRRTNLKVFPIEIFQYMNVLKSLDMSDNRSLIEIPAKISSLINLEYLNIVDTGVERLPVEVEQLKKLRFLLLNCETLIPRGVISNLCSLQTFEQNFDLLSYVGYEAKLRRSAMGREMLGELEGLEHIMDLSLVIFGVTSFQILLNSPKLQSCTRELRLYDWKSLPDMLGEKAVLDLCTDGRLNEHLEELYLAESDMSTMKFGSSSSSSLGNLRYVSISACHKLRNVSSLAYVPNLCTLDVKHCNSIEELIGEKFFDTSSLLFSSLMSLILLNLPKLRSVCPYSALPFPSLKLMRVFGCDSLIKLPLDSNTAKTTSPKLKIVGNRDWWDNVLQWDNQETKNAFTPKAILV